MKKVLYLFSLLALCLVGCKENDDTIDEFPDWAHQNDVYYGALVSEAMAKKAAGDTTWDVLVSYSAPATGYACQYYDYVVVEKLEEAQGTRFASPVLTDTVEVHYVGTLKTSADRYSTQGMEFDRSYAGTFNPETATPAKFAVNKVVKGFGTALLNMRHGDKSSDHWRVYIPYQLGYGTAASGSIPGGSTLIFDLRLQDFWRKTKGDRYE